MGRKAGDKSDLATFVLKLKKDSVEEKWLENQDNKTLSLKILIKKALYQYGLQFALLNDSVRSLELTRHRRYKAEIAESLILEGTDYISIDIGQGTTDMALFYNGSVNDFSYSINSGFGNILEDTYNL